MRDSFFSLSRFFHQEVKDFPCWLVGRFHPQSRHRFELKSQGLSLLCHIHEEESLDVKAKAGDWVAVKINQFKKKEAFIKDYKIISVCQKPYKANEGFAVIVQDWSQFLNKVESFFKSKGLICVDTPSLVKCPGTEPYLLPFETEINVDNKKEKLFLNTSPEMHLKKLLCQDWTDFFEIKRCFRNGELSSIHEPEFHMLEWYRSFFILDDLIQDVIDFFNFLSQQSFFKGKPPLFKEYSVKDLFLKFLKFSLTPETTREELFSLSQKENLVSSKDDSWDDLFHLIFLNCIETKLEFNLLTVVRDYPPSLRAFSRINSSGWADRFEIYWRGFELANAFYEVIDREEQKKLFQQHLKQRTDSVSYDKELLELMSQGMPPCSGIAVGLDRLFLAISQRTQLSQIRLFPYGK